MFIPLATKVSTSLSKNVQIGPKVSIFCVATIIFQHCLNPLGHQFTRASQVATGVLFHSSMKTSQSWWMLESLRSFTVRLRMTNRLPTFTLSFFSKAVVVLEVCLGLLSCWNTALRPSLQREGIMLCFSMLQYMLAFMVPSRNCSSSNPCL